MKQNSYSLARDSNDQPVLYSKTYTHLLVLGVRRSSLSASSGIFVGFFFFGFGLIFDDLRIHFQKYVMYVCDMGEGAWVPQQLCGSHDSFLDWFSPFFLWVPGIGPRSPGLYWKRLYPLSNLASPSFSFLRKAEK